MQIDPVAFHFFGIAVYWYGIMISLGMFLGALVARKRAKYYGISEDELFNFLLLAIPTAIVGTRVAFVMANWSMFAGDWLSILNFRQGGLAIHGGILGGILAGAIYSWAKKINFWVLGDICAPALILGQAIGRWGNFFNQEAYGVPTQVPWAMFIEGAYRHPIFLYEFLWNLLVFAYMLNVTKKEKTPGGIFLRYIIGYSIGRYFIEGLRADTLFWANFRAGQLVSIVFILVGVALLIWRKRQAPQFEKGDRS